MPTFFTRTSAQSDDRTICRRCADGQRQVRAHGHLTIKSRARTRELQEVVDSCTREPSGPRHHRERTAAMLGSRDHAIERASTRRRSSQDSSQAPSAPAGDWIGAAVERRRYTLTPAVNASAYNPFGRRPSRRSPRPHTPGRRSPRSRSSGCP